MLASVKVAAVEEPDVPKTTNSKHGFLYGVLVASSMGLIGLGVGGAGEEEGCALGFHMVVMNESGTCGLCGYDVVPWLNMERCLTRQNY